MTDESKRKPSIKKSVIAGQRLRVGGRFVSSKLGVQQKKISDKPLPEELYVITDEDRAKFGKDSKAFFEWAITKAATRYEAAKYAKELLRFQYPSLQAVQSKTEIEVTSKKLHWEWGNDAQEIEYDPPPPSIVDLANELIEQRSDDDLEPEAIY